MSVRIFVGKINTRTTEDTLHELFSKYGTIQKIELKIGFGFIYYDTTDEANSAIDGMNGQEVDGNYIIVEKNKSMRESKPKPIKRLDLRLAVHGIDSRISWQDLKDWARESGDVTFANVFSREGKSVGVIEFLDEETMERAARELEEIPLRGMKVRLEKEDPNAEATYDQQPRPRFRDNFDGPGSRPHDRFNGGDRFRGYDGPPRGRFRGDRGGFDGRPGGFYDRGMDGPYDGMGAYPPAGFDRGGGGYPSDSRGRYQDDYPRRMGGGPGMFRDRPRSRSRERGPPMGGGMYERGPPGGYSNGPPGRFMDDRPGRYYNGGGGGYGRGR